VNDTRILCAVCGIWQCLARHGGGTCHAVNGPSDTSCGACYANRPTLKPDLTVAIASPLPEEPPTDVDWHSVALELNDIIERATEITNPAGSIRRLLERRPTLAALAAKYPASSERSRLAGENAELRDGVKFYSDHLGMVSGLLTAFDPNPVALYTNCADHLEAVLAGVAELRKENIRLLRVDECTSWCGDTLCPCFRPASSPGAITPADETHWMVPRADCTGPVRTCACGYNGPAYVDEHLHACPRCGSIFAGATGDRE
jgi:hypothetical protein